MSDAGLSANASRGVKFGSEPASGLNDGDVVAFLDPDSGKPYAVRREEDLTEGRGEAVFLFGVDLDAAEASVATARTLERLRNNENLHLEVHAHGDFVGFRAAGANGRLLQATRKGACRLRFHGECFGTWEEWFLDARVAAEARETKWARLTVVLRHRRLEKLELRVTLVRLGRAKEAEEALRGSAAQTPARSAAAAATPGRCPRPRGTRGAARPRAATAAAAPAGHGRGRHARTSPRSTPACCTRCPARWRRSLSWRCSARWRRAPRRSARWRRCTPRARSCAGGRSASLSGCGRTGRSAWTRLPATRRTCARRRRRPSRRLAEPKKPRRRVRGGDARRLEPSLRGSARARRRRNAHAARADARRRACSIDAWRARWIPGLKTSRTRSARAAAARARVSGATNPWLRPLARGASRGAARRCATAPSPPPSRARASPRWHRRSGDGSSAWRSFARAHPRADARMRSSRRSCDEAPRAIDAWFDQRENAAKIGGRVRNRAAAHPAGNRRERDCFRVGGVGETARDAAAPSRARARRSPRPRRVLLAVARVHEA